MYPGTACGNEPGEAIHGPWQRALAAQRAPPTLGNIFGITQNIYNDHWATSFEWTSTERLGPVSTAFDRALLDGQLLCRVGRTPALSFAERAAAGTHVYVTRVVSDDLAVVAVCRSADAALNDADANAGIDLLFEQASDERVRDSLVACGILLPATVANTATWQILAGYEWPHAFAGHGKKNTLVFKNSAFNKIFVDIAYVIITKSGASCTCSPHMLYKQCEHVVFAESVELSCRAATRDFAALPQQRKRGRPRGTVLSPRGKKAAK